MFLKYWQCLNVEILFYIRMTDKTIALTKDDDDGCDIYQINALREYSLSGHSTQIHRTKKWQSSIEYPWVNLGPLQREDLNNSFFTLLMAYTMALSYSSIWNLVRVWVCMEAGQKESLLGHTNYMCIDLHGTIRVSFLFYKKILSLSWLYPLKFHFHKWTETEWDFISLKQL